MEIEKTTADLALSGISAVADKVAPVVDKKEGVMEVDKKEGVAPVASTSKRYLPGMYRSDRYMRIIKELTHVHRKDDNGKVQKTYGTWVRDDNMIVFKKGVETRLTAEDLTLPAVQRLIDSKIIYRLG